MFRWKKGCLLYTSGEGGALLVRDPKYIESAEIIREKGTNRSKFFRGEIDKYNWVEMGDVYKRQG